MAACFTQLLTLFWTKIRRSALGLAASATAIVSVAANNPATPATVPTTAPVAATTEFPPVHLANDAFRRTGPADEYLNELDPKTLRTPESAPAGHIKSLISNIPKDGHYTDLDKILARRIYVAPLNRVRGKRIRVSGWIKTNNVRECAGLQMLAYSAGGELLVTDEMISVRPIHGTTDWRKYEMVQDIPPDAAKILLGAALFCSGEIWIDDFQVEVVGNDVPLTDDQNWQIFSPIAQRYTAAIDPAIKRDGHATTCIASRTAPYSGWAILGHYELRPDPKFLGHRIRVTAWMKSSGVTGGSGFQINTFAPWDKELTTEGQRGHRPLIGTHDWHQYTAVANVPLETRSIYWGLTMNGNGKIWIDLDSVQVDLADAPPTK